LYTHLWGVQAGEIDELPEEFIERARERRAEVDREAIEAEVESDD